MAAQPRIRNPQGPSRHARLVSYKVNVMAEMSQTRNVTPLSMRAAITPASMNEEARTVEIVWTTGARVKRSSWWDGDFYEELSLDPRHVRMARLESGTAPFLADHRGQSIDSVLGVIVSARLERERGIATVRFAKDDPAADAAWNKVRQGILPNVSVGYRVHKMEKVEGGDESTPVFRAMDWEPIEVSLVTIGADASAHVRSVLDSNPCEFISRGEAPHKENRMPEEMKNPAPVPAQADAARMAEMETARTEAAKAERERASTITSVVTRAGLAADFARKLVDEGVPVDVARARTLDELAKRSDSHGPAQTPSGAVEVTATERDKRLRGMTAWLLERSGVVPTIERARHDAKHARHFKDVATDGGEFRGLSLVDVARECLERSGVSTRGMDRMTLVGRAFTQRSSGYQTTSDFAVLFENVMHKILLGAYAVTPDTWSLFCKTDTVSDFRPSNRFRTGSFGTLDPLNEHGEFKNKAFPDGEKRYIEVGTKGNIFALTRQAIINDDMGALSDLASKFGRAARLSIESDVYALLNANSGLGPTQSDTNPFFHSTRANVNGTGSALGVAGLDADRIVMAKQKDISSNEYLDLRPSILLVNIGLGGEARTINDSQFDTDPVTTNATNKFMKPNRVRGLFRTIVDTPRLTDTTRRYLFTDPGIAAAIVVAFLEGQGESPVLESQDGWRVDGTEWKVRLDYKAQMFDPKGAVTNAGA